MSVIVPPRQLEVGLLTAKVGWKTFTVTMLVVLQPVSELVASTEYVVVLRGFTMVAVVVGPVFQL